MPSFPLCYSSLVVLLAQSVPFKSLEIASKAIQPTCTVPHSCSFPMDILIIQDATSSFEDDIANVRETQLPLMFDAMAKAHPDTAYGLISVQDKPIAPFGHTYDKCLKFESPLSTNTSELIEAYKGLSVQGGGDPPEAQFWGIVAAMKAPMLQRRLNEQSVKLVVVMTDSQPHYAYDTKESLNLKPYSGILRTDDILNQCAQEDYPSMSDVYTALKSRKAYAAFLVYGNSQNNGQTLPAWNYVNEELKQVSNFVKDMENSSLNFWKTLAEIIHFIECQECALADLPTADPSQRPQGGTLSHNTSIGTCKNDCECFDYQVMLKFSERPKKMIIDIQIES